MLKRLSLLFCCCWLMADAIAQSNEQEADLKAVFIYNFTRYIDWDSTGIGDDFVIGIIGSNDINSPLTQIARNNQVNGKRIVLRNWEKPEQIGDCQLLFIGREAGYPLREILSRVGKGVLTVSEEPGMAKEGTAFNFVVVNNKLKFEANLEVISLAGLKAGSQLLKLAIIIN